MPLETPRSGGGYSSLGFSQRRPVAFGLSNLGSCSFFCTRLKLGQNSQFLFGRLMPATFVAALARFPAASSPKAAQKGQLAKGRRGERAEEEEQEGEGAQRDRDAAPRRQDLGDVNEGHCEGRRRKGGRARMETSNGKPKLPLPFLPSSLFVVVVVFFLSFSLTHSPLPS